MTKYFTKDDVLLAIAATVIFLISFHAFALEPKKYPSIQSPTTAQGQCEGPTVQVVQIGLQMGPPHRIWTGPNAKRIVDSLVAIMRGAGAQIDDIPAYDRVQSYVLADRELAVVLLSQGECASAMARLPLESYVGLLNQTSAGQ